LICHCRQQFHPRLRSARLAQEAEGADGRLASKASIQIAQIPIAKELDGRFGGLPTPITFKSQHAVMLEHFAQHAYPAYRLQSSSASRLTAGRVFGLSGERPESALIQINAWLRGGHARLAQEEGAGGLN